MILSIADAFIKRPVLTTVCTIIIVLLGAVCTPLLPVEYIPQIAPIQVQVSASYQGADPQTIETTVTTPIERALTGTVGMQYLTSNSAVGSTNISAYFSSDSDKNIDQVNIQNNLQQAVSQLPAAVQQTGITVKVASTSILQIYGFYSPNNQYDSVFISNYVDLYVNDEIARINGVGLVTISGQHQYAMRIWLDPNALASRGLTVGDVENAVKSQNLVLGGGAIGGDPAPKGQKFEIPLVLNGQFQKVADAENLVVKTASNGALIKIKDVGRVELAALAYNSVAKANGKPGVALNIYQLPGSNALSIEKLVKAKMEQLRQNFPPGLTVVPVYDTVSFIQESTKEAVITLLEAVGLVTLVIFVFLQDWRATMIPAIAIPVSLIGSMIFAKLFSFSINTLTLFGVVLATGLVVDDAILVVEAIAAKMENEGLSPRQASIEAMNELTGAVIATSLVLMAVFVPVAFFPGATGQLYKQFALIIAFSIAVSAFNALTFTPTVAALLLRPQQPHSSLFGWFFSTFNRTFAWILQRYKAIVKLLIKLRYLVIGLFVVGLALTVVVFNSVPVGFVPSEDQGSISGIVQGPDVASLQTTTDTLDKVQQILAKIPEITAISTISGSSANGNAVNRGVFFATLKPWSERPKASQSVSSILQRLNKTEFPQKIPGALVLASSPAPIPGFSSTGGISLQLEDTTNGKYHFEELQKNAQAILQETNKTGLFQPPGAYTQFSANSVQYKVNINRDQVNALNVNFNDVLSTLSTSFAGVYVNQFVLGPRYYRVYVQLDDKYRSQPQDLKQLYVRSSNGQMVSLDQFVTFKPFTGPAVISHFNEYRTILMQGNPAVGASSGQAIAALQGAFQKVALSGISFDWSDLSRQEVATGSLGALIFVFGIYHGVLGVVSPIRELY